MHSVIIISFVLITSYHLGNANPLSQLFGAIDIETPPYDVMRKGGAYEVRRYRSQLWAQVEYTVDPSTDFGDKGSMGFKPLFGYISGKNDRKLKIPMTAPVVMQQVAGDTSRRRMAFIMPASQFSRLDQLPQPDSLDVKIVAIDKPSVLACITFNMGLTNKRVATKEAELRTAAKNDQVVLVEARDDIRVGGYNPPWTLPWLRTNELCIPLVDQS